MTIQEPPLSGWLILDKPTDMTSAHAVNKVKRLLKPKKIGHAGTLDPLASGILPLALGEATKTIAYMMDAVKSYAFTVAWGEQRDTDDREGKVIANSTKRPFKSEIEAILPQLIGHIEQMPPQFSALKVDGERAYDLAREGKVAELKARRVRVDSLKPCGPSFADAKDGSTGSQPDTGWDPAQPPGGSQDYTTFICHCGKGTYIRSLARDMGIILGCYGHVSMLRRLSVGKFSEKDAISLENLEKMMHTGGLSLLPVESALDDILALDITPPQATLLKRGQAISVAHDSEGIMLAQCDGKPVALCEVSRGTMKPSRVFNL
jgi:tRNA pseudouridine55 synthase